MSVSGLSEASQLKKSGSPTLEILHPEYSRSLPVIVGPGEGKVNSLLALKGVTSHSLASMSRLQRDISCQVLEDSESAEVPERVRDLCLSIPRANTRSSQQKSKYVVISV